VALEHLRMSVATQDGDLDSMLAFYRRMLAWRKARRVFTKGGFTLHQTSDSLISYVRGQGEEAVFCSFNLGDAPLDVQLPPGHWRAIEVPTFLGAIRGSTAELPPCQALFAERG
jgi:alpha-glucosidase